MHKYYYAKSSICNLSLPTLHKVYDNLFSFIAILPLVNYMDWVVYKLHQTRLILTNTFKCIAYTIYIHTQTRTWYNTNRIVMTSIKWFFFRFGSQFKRTYKHVFPSDILSFSLSPSLSLSIGLAFTFHEFNARTAPLKLHAVATAAATAALKTCKSCLTALLCFGIIFVLGECKQ